jgi:dTDP-4-dehydrorhamnose 3,5-epimerase-like enzyme
MYKPSHEDALNIYDPLLNINLPLDIIEISKKDKEHKLLDKNFQGIKI